MPDTQHEVILDIAARACDGLDGDPFGSSYIRDSFTRHISLASFPVTGHPRIDSAGTLDE